MSGFRIVRATVADGPQMAALLRRAYFPYEPLSSALALEGNHVDYDVDVLLKPLHLGYSFLAFDNKKLVGLCINREKDHIEEVEHLRNLAKDCPIDKMKNLYKFLATVEEKADFWNRFGVKKAYFIETVAIDPTVRTRGIGQVLGNACLDFGSELGYEISRADVTNIYSAKGGLNLGMTKCYSLKYEDFTGDDGKPIFPVEPPHTEYAILYKWNSELKNITNKIKCTI